MSFFAQRVEHLAAVQRVTREPVWYVLFLGGRCRRLLYVAYRSILVSISLTPNLGSLVVFDCIGDITSTTLSELLTHDRQLRTAQEPPRTLVRIASRGGETDAGLALYQAIRSLPGDVVTYAVGNISSAATIAFCAGARRLITPMTRVVLHAPQWTPEGRYSLEELRNVLAITEHRFQMSVDVLAATTGRKPTVVAAELQRGRLLTAAEAVRLRLATAIARAVMFQPQQV